MSTLHTLRRHYDLSLGELAQLTGIPLRRLAEYEYEDRPLPLEDQRALVSLFSRDIENMGSGWDAAAPPGARNGRSDRTVVLAAFAATVALSGTLGLGGALRDAATRLLDAGTTALDVVPALLQGPAPATPTPEPTLLPAAIVLPIVPLPTGTAAPAPTATPEPIAPPEPAYPHRCPVSSTHGTIVVMADYTAGTHEPQSINGAIDLAIDANGDGLPETWASRDTAVYATHDGVAHVSLDNWLAGNFVTIDGAEGWRTGYSHLERVDVNDGERVQTGQRIGTIGTTGQAGGPHLDYKVWHDGKNTDPTPMLDCR